MKIFSTPLVMVYSSMLIIAIVVLFSSAKENLESENVILQTHLSNSITQSQKSDFKPNNDLRFIANKGQLGSEIKFHTSAAGHEVLFYPDQVVFKRREIKEFNNEISLRFDGAAKNPSIQGNKVLKEHANFYLGNEEESWQNNVETYNAVQYQGIYKGIDMAYFGGGGILESEFYVSPGIDYHQIELHYSGVKSKEIQSDGSLLLITQLGKLIEKAPYAFQEKDGLKVEVEAKYAVLANGNIGFELGKYDPNKQVIIDPEIIFETTSGEKIGAWASDVAIDSDGNIIAIGASNRFYPATEEIDESNHSPGFGNDGLLLKVDGQTGEILSSALFGGSKYDVFESVAIAGNGNIYVAGSTESDNFPIKNASQDTYGGGQDAFLVVFDAQLNLLSSRYIGGSKVDAGDELVLDADGNVYVGGTTESDDLPDANGYQKVNGGNFDLFIIKCDAIGNTVYTSYLGGSGSDQIRGITVDESGQATVVCNTLSTNFPLKNAFQDTFGGEHWGTGDIAVSQLNAEGTNVMFSTYFGGSVEDWATGISYDMGIVSVAGGSMSNDFPTMNHQQDTSTSTSAVLIRLNESGQPVLSARTPISSEYGFEAIAKGDSNSVFLTSGNEDSLYLYQYTPPVNSAQSPTLKSASNFDVGTFAFILAMRVPGVDITSLEFYNNFIYYVGALTDLISSVSGLYFAGIQLEDPPKLEDFFDIEGSTVYLQIHLKDQTENLIADIDKDGYLRLNGLSTKYKAKDIKVMSISGNNKNNHLDLSKVSKSEFPNMTGAALHGREGNDRLEGPADLNSLLSGGDGSDELVGGTGTDEFHADWDDMGVFSGGGEDKVTIDTQYKPLNSKHLSFNKDWARITENTLIINDVSGYDTLSFAGSDLGIHFNLSQLGSPQVVDSNGHSVQLDGQFESLIGTPQNDILSVAPLSNEMQLVNGGDGVDTLHYLSDQPATDDGEKISAEGLADILYDSIEVVVLHGGSSTSLENDISNDNPFTMKVFPNPFTNFVQLSYTLHTQAEVSFTIYDIQGKVAYQIDQNSLGAGSHLIEWDGVSSNEEKVQPGNYIYVLRVNNHKWMGKLVLSN